MLTASQVLGFVLVDLILILIAARAVGYLATRVGQPRVVGEIVAGVLLGPTLLGPALAAWENPPRLLDCADALSASEAAMSVSSCLFPPQATAVLGVLGQVALMLFMFLVGLELDLDSLRGRGRAVAVVSLGVVAVPVGLGFALQPILYTPLFAPEGTPALAFNLTVGAMLSVTALAVLARILQEKKLTATTMGAVAIAAGAVVTVLMFLLLSVAQGVATGAEGTAIGRSLVLAVAYIAAMLFVVRPALAPLGRRYEANRERRAREREQTSWSERSIADAPGVGHAFTTPMFATIIILVFASALVAHLLGVNVLVGGFMAGLVLPARRGLMADLTAELFDLTAVILLPVFMAFSGLATDFSQLRVSALPGIAAFVVAAVASKWLSGALCARASGLSWPDANMLGVLMNTRGLLVLVAGLSALQQGVITPTFQLAGVTMALVTTAMTGPLVDRLSRAPAPAEPVPAPA